jgi:hypothetical protein
MQTWHEWQGVAGLLLLLLVVVLVSLLLLLLLLLLPCVLLTPVQPKVCQHQQRQELCQGSRPCGWKPAAAVQGHQLGHQGHHQRIKEATWSQQDQEGAIHLCSKGYALLGCLQQLLAGGCFGGGVGDGAAVAPPGCE